MFIFFPAVTLPETLAAVVQEETGRNGGLSKVHVPMAPTQDEDTRPVTLGEAYIVFSKVEAAFASLVNAPVKGAPASWKGSSTSATREQIVIELNTIAKEFLPTYKVFPRPQWVDPQFIQLPPQAKADAVFLAKLGFIGPVGELVHGPAKSLAMAQFGRQMGFFIGRWSDMTNMPDIKWTPYLQKNEQPVPPSGAKPTSQPPPKKAG